VAYILIYLNNKGEVPWDIPYPEMEDIDCNDILEYKK